MYNVAREFCRNGIVGMRHVAMPDHSFDGDSFDGDVREYPASGGGFKTRTGATTEFSNTTPLKTCPVGAIGEQL